LLPEEPLPDEDRLDGCGGAGLGAGLGEDDLLEVRRVVGVTKGCTRSARTSSNEENGFWREMS
jgi:hypothetical protein